MLGTHRSPFIFGLLAAAALTLSACAESSPGTDPTGADGGQDAGTDGVGTDTGFPSDVTSDTTPPEGCPNGVREGAEQCDDGAANANTPNACRTNCTTPVCGDLIVDNAAPYNEECDDGNDDDTDGCTSSCLIAVALICDPCTANAECGGGQNACVALGGGSFCGTPCGAGCPDGFICDEVTDVAGSSLQQCVPASGTCSDCFDPDRDGYGAGSGCTAADCDQNDAEVHPGAEEMCDGVDNNCSGEVDEGLELSSFYPDADLDGHGDENKPPTAACVAPEGMVSSNDDCDDSDRFTHPGAAELCDDADNDCDGQPESEDVDFDWYPDEDGDGYGFWLATATSSCSLVEGHATNSEDCDDGNGLTNPDAAEVCDDEVDNNCDFATDCSDSACSALPACNLDCEETGVEPNDSADAAALIGPGGFTGQHACADNEDWYSITLDADDAITVTATFLHAQGDIDLVFFDPFGNIISSSESEDDNEELVANAPTSGTYRILVYLYSDTGDIGGVTYDLDVAVVEAPETCHDDGFEPNDEADAAAPLEVGAYPDMVACERDFDFYDIALNVDDTVTIDVIFDHELGDINAVLEDTEGNAVVEAFSDDSNEELVYTAPIAGTYTLVVFLYTFDERPEGSPYGLDIAVGEVPGDCEDDRFEDNDVRANPATVGPSEFPELVACPNDADFFAVDLNADDEIVIDLGFSQAGGNIDLRLYNPEGEAVAASASIDDDEHVAYTALLSGTFLIEVFYFHPSAELGNAYSMTVAVNTPQPECEPDSLEDNDALEDAFGIGEGTLDGLTACAGDLDWYSVVLGAGDTIDVDLTFLDAAADLDLSFTDDRGTLLAFSVTGDDNEEIEWVASSSGTYYITVGLKRDTDDDPTNNVYALSAAITPGVPTCTDDDHEENDVLAEASEIASGSFASLVSCEGDLDYYRVDLGVGDEITIGLVFIDGEGDIDLYLRDAEGASLASSLSFNDNEDLSWTADEAGPVFIHVRLFRDEGSAPGNTYGMDVDVVEATPTCAADALEENDTQDTAAPVLSESYPNLTACVDDADYYEVFLFEGATITVDLTFSHAEGDIDVEIVEPDGDWVAYSESEDDDESVEYTATQSGTYAIRVYIYEDTGDTPGNNYDMTVDIPATTSCVDDDSFEDNDNANDARYLSSGTVESLWACGTDRDFYEVLGITGETLSVALAFAHSDADIDVEVYPAAQCGLGECTGDPVNDGDAGYSLDDNELVEWDVTSTAFYVVVVYVAGAEGGEEAEYSMTYSYE